MIGPSSQILHLYKSSSHGTSHSLQPAPDIEMGKEPDPIIPIAGDLPPLVAGGQVGSVSDGKDCNDVSGYQYGWPQFSLSEGSASGTTFAMMGVKYLSFATHAEQQPAEGVFRALNLSQMHSWAVIHSSVLGAPQEVSFFM